jgi:hypothetical protein
MKKGTPTLLQAGTMNDELRITNTSVVISFVTRHFQPYFGIPFFHGSSSCTGAAPLRVKITNGY